MASEDTSLDVAAAIAIHRAIDPNWLVVACASYVILDGHFTAEQLEAIAYLLRHDPDELIELSDQ